MKLNQINKRLFIYMGIAIAIIIIIFVVLFFISGDVKLDYKQIEQRLKDSAVKYYKDNPDLLPKNNGGQVTVSAFELEQGKYISKLQNWVKGEAVCTGEVEVTKNGDQYLYSPHLNCGNEYTSLNLYSVITDEKNIVTKGDGLYVMNNEYVFRGEHVNNYVKFADKVWRIVKIDNSNGIKLIIGKNKEKFGWDDRYNIEKNATIGINDYKLSRIRDYLLNMYMNEEFFDNSSRANIAYKDICVGKRKETQTVNDNSVECATVLESQPISLLQVNEFLNASLDKNCKKTNDSSCQNYNYLADSDYTWWSLTGDADNTFKVYKLSSSGVELSNALSYITVKPVIYLSSAVMYTSGSGTAEDPYIVK